MPGWISMRACPGYMHWQSSLEALRAGRDALNDRIAGLAHSSHLVMHGLGR
jgi:hypothetical protein